ncbi:MAG TPA: alpha-2-macroglobulin family protein [Kofleriaceae bacterium]|jgi:hypothetical protein
MKKLALVALALATACGSKSSTPSGGSPLADKVKRDAKDAPDGLDLRLSNGKQLAPPYDRANLAPATKLADAAAQALLARGKPITVDPADLQTFALRPASLPPPRTGDTVASSFPPPASSVLPPPRASDAGKGLEVLRWMPEGKVPLAPELSVTFSQPMVAVTSQEDASATTPIKLTPQPKGRWRWIGTRTILFDPDVRFPQATTYTVEIPAGTRSASGATLAKTKTFTFETPPPTLVASYPNDPSAPQHLDVPIFIKFDQKVDVQAVLSAIQVKVAAGWDGRPVKIRALDAKEIEHTKDQMLGALVAGSKEEAGRWLAFRTVDPLPPDATVDVTIPAGTPSQEGPNKTTTAQAFQFHTYPPFKLVQATCGWGAECRPGVPFVFQFNNPIDVDKFDDQLVSLAPGFAGAKIVGQGNYVMVQGLQQARTTYKMTVSGKLVDEFGQALGKDEQHSFAVGDAYPQFFGAQGLVVLDPSAKHPTLDVFTTNYDQLKVKLYSVTPADFDAYNHFIANRWNHDHPPAAPGTKVFDATVKTTGGKNELAETHVALDRALPKSGLGHVFAIVTPYPWTESYPAPELVAWIESTHLAVDAHVDGDSLVAMATELATGKPAGNVALEIRPYGVTGETDATGMATLALAAAGTKGANYLVAKRGDDVAFVAEYPGSGAEYGTWAKTSRGTQLAWYVIDDRKLYKPGEDVTLKGWLRAVDYGKTGDVGWTNGQSTGVTYKVYDSLNNQIATGTAPVDAIGGFDTKFTLPKTPNLGSARVEFIAAGNLAGTYSHAFQIEEFRRPEFEVNAHASQGPFLVGGGGDITVDAKYYSGGPLPGAPVAWNVTATQTSFTPPNRDDYTFGNWTPWWGWRGWYDDFGSADGYKPPKMWNLADKTDATGSHVLHLDFLSVKPAMPMTVTANASVTDVNRQTWTAAATMIVHPSKLYVGVKAKRPFVDQGTPFDLDVIGVDLDGKAVPGTKIEVDAVRLDYEYKKGRYAQKEVDPQTCPLVAAADAQQCHFATKVGGTYQVTATIVDDQGRANQTKMEFWVSGGDVPPAREVAQERVQIIPDKKDYAPGQTAELLVQAPFYPAEALVTWRRSGIVKTERVTFDSATKVLNVPITDAMTPNLYVQVDLVGAAARTDDHGKPDPSLPKRPAYAAGSIDLPIPPRQRTLDVKVSPAVPKLGPGEATKIAVLVTDAAGKPVANATTSLIVVDESVLALAAYTFPNPIDTFYVQRDAGTRDSYERAYVKLARPDVAALAPADPSTGVNLPGGGGGRYRRGDATGEGMIVDGAFAQGAPAMPEATAATPPMRMHVVMKSADKAENDEDQTKGNLESPPPPPPGPAIAIRSNFNPLAAFAAAVKTGADGRAVIDIKMPDNLTRYRVVAIAVAGDKQFGKGESALTARLPLMVRPSPPRFLNFGDTFQLPVVVQNQTDSAMTVQVAVRATNATLTDGAGRQVSVPANDRVEVLFPAAAEMAGTARIQVIGSAGAATDAAELALPVWTPATTEAFATYGVIDAGAMKQPIALPGKVVTQFGGLDVTTSSTNLQSLTDALLYLVHYPFECAEQRSSRILAIAALRDVLTAFHTKDMPSAAQMEHSVDEDIEHLTQMQNYDGGFAWWDRGYPSDPYLSVFVVNALAHAKAKGFTVPDAMFALAKPYLQRIEDHIPWYYSDDERHAIEAYALYTRKQLGDLDVAKGKRLYAAWGAPDKVTMETDGWLLGTFAGQAAASTERAALVRYAENHVSETAGAANFTTSYGDGNYLLLSSDRRVDGVMLESLIEEQPGNDLIPKLVTGLLAHRKGGRWENTQENAFVLLALDLYFHTYEKVTPDFVARVWLGNDYAGDHTFKGRTTEYADVQISMKDVASHDRQDLTIQKDGAGRLYYRIGMTYAPASLHLDAADYGFVVERRYEGADDPKDVTRAADGTWHVKAGARVRVRVTMVNENRRYQVALVDPIPAGFEPMNPALATTGPIPLDPNVQKSRGAYWWWYGPWWEHQNMRDERVEAFASLLWEGVHEYTYVARATTPGNFVVPPPKAEEMYMPETFGRGASDRVIVE